MSAARVQIRLIKARDFLKGMALPDTWEETGCRYSSALLAVHSAISYGDALGEGLERDYKPAQGHGTLATRLEKLLTQRSYLNKQGIGHLKSLLQKKSKVAYSPDAITEEEAKAMIDKARRFSTWANTTGNELKIEGWRDDAS